jgi:peptidyl-tRNA hydrolase, PTH1 family
VAALAARNHGRFKTEKGLHAQVCTVQLAGSKVMLAVPVTYMNESGRSVAPLVRRAGLEDVVTPDGKQSANGGPEPVTAQLIVVHDELDLPAGRVKIKAGGGTAGHNGLKSIESHLHTRDYVRVRVGIGKPPGQQRGADFVLRRPGAAERAVLVASIEAAADAVESIVADGLDAAMNRINSGA